MTNPALMMATLWFSAGFLGTLHLVGYALGWWPIGAGSVTWWLVLALMLGMSILETVSYFGGWRS